MSSSELRTKLTRNVTNCLQNWLMSLAVKVETAPV